jgi:hypothetical protein
MKNNSGVLHLVSVLILIAAATYAWPDVLKAIEKGAFEGAKAGAEAAVEKAIDKLTPSWVK